MPSVRSTQKLPMRAGAAPGQAADQGDGDRDADRGGDEVLDGEAGHLGEMAHRGLARVVLPVRVGEEAHRRVEGEEAGHALRVRRVQRQVLLDALEPYRNTTENRLNASSASA